MEIIKSSCLLATVLESSPETNRVRGKTPLIVVSAYASKSTLKCLALKSRNGVCLGTPLGDDGEERPV